MYGGMQPGFWNDGAHGVITRRPEHTQYVHVLTKPMSQDLVRLRDNGYHVTGVTDVRTGKAFRFNQSGGYLSILGVTAWDTYDTVFKVTTDGQHRAVPAVDAQGDGVLRCRGPSGGQPGRRRAIRPTGMPTGSSRRR